MSQEELPEIAAAVGRALGLRKQQYMGTSAWTLGDGSAHVLWEHGSNVFADPWFRLCVLWLLERGHSVSIALMGDGRHGFWEAGDEGWLFITCPAAEFPARCIAALVREEK